MIRKQPRQRSTHPDHQNPPHPQIRKKYEIQKKLTFPNNIAKPSRNRTRGRENAPIEEKPTTQVAKKSPHRSGSGRISGVEETMAVERGKREPNKREREMGFSISLFSWCFLD